MRHRSHHPPARRNRLPTRFKRGDHGGGGGGGGGGGDASTDDDDARRISPRKWGRWCRAACLRAVSSEAFPLPAASPCVDDEPEELAPPPAEEFGFIQHI
jgi:hypothetical protein